MGLSPFRKPLSKDFYELTKISCSRWAVSLVQKEYNTIKLFTTNKLVTNGDQVVKKFIWVKLIVSGIVFDAENLPIGQELPYLPCLVLQFLMLTKFRSQLASNLLNQAYLAGNSSQVR